MCVSAVGVQVLLAFYLWAFGSYKGSVCNFDCIGFDSLKLFASNLSGD